MHRPRRWREASKLGLGRAAAGVRRQERWDCGGRTATRALEHRCKRCRVWRKTPLQCGWAQELPLPWFLTVVKPVARNLSDPGLWGERRAGVCDCQYSCAACPLPAAAAAAAAVPVPQPPPPPARQPPIHSRRQLAATKRPRWKSGICRQQPATLRCEDEASHACS